MTVLVETRADLTLETARRVAWEGEGVEFGARALAAMAQGRKRLERILDHDPEITIYGVTTGPGRLARTKLTPEQREQWAGMSPARAAASWGDPLPERVVRSIVLARLTNFVEGHAAVSPEIAQGVAAMLGEDRLPVVPAKGQGGAGEILSLSHLFTGLGGEGGARDQGRAVPDQRVAGGHGPCHTMPHLLPRTGSIWRRRSLRCPSRHSTRRLAISTPRLPTTGTTPTTPGRSGAFANWWETVTVGNGAPIRHPSVSASFRECWARPGVRRPWPPRSPRSRSRP